MVFHIKRFEGLGTKASGFYEYRLKIEMSMFLNKEDNVYDQETRYELIGMTEHLGRTNLGGHYIACTLRNENWYMFDDDNV